LSSKEFFINAKKITIIKKNKNKQSHFTQFCRHMDFFACIVFPIDKIQNS
jgi:hypothetical protein